jgi:Domain of unknown function (DUF4326)
MTQPEPRVTAYRYVYDHGLLDRLGTMDALLEIGLQAARLGHWYGIGEQKVAEGSLNVHTWPAAIWAEVIAKLPPGWVPPPRPDRGMPLYGSRSHADGLPPVSVPTTVVHCMREPYDVLIDRSTPWGNPYLIGREYTREQVIAAYERYLPTRPDLLARLPGLRGKRLGCYCKPLACHGDVLARLADGIPQEQPVTPETAARELVTGQRRYMAMTDAELLDVDAGWGPGIPPWDGDDM